MRKMSPRVTYHFKALIEHLAAMRGTEHAKHGGQLCEGLAHRNAAPACSLNRSTRRT